MFKTANRLSLAVLACGVMLAGCATTGKGPAKSGAQLVSSAKDSKSSVMAEKSNAKKTTTPPKAIPQSVLGGGQTIAPPAIRDYQALEAWDIEGLDLDGDYDLETGLACYDSSSDTLYVWWEDVTDLGGDGDMEVFDGFFWVSDASAGVILDLKSDGEDDIVACVSQVSGWSGWIVEASNGESEVMALDASYTRWGGRGPMSPRRPVRTALAVTQVEPVVKVEAVTVDRVWSASVLGFEPVVDLETSRYSASEAFPPHLSAVMSSPRTGSV